MERFRSSRPRIAGISVLLGADDPAAVAAQLGRLYYDLAGSASAAVVSSLLTLVDRRQVLYGSDWPFTPEPIVATALGWITVDDNMVSPVELSANAAALFPRLAPARS